MSVSIGVDIGDVNARSALARPGEAGQAFPIGQERDRVTPAVVALNRDGRLLAGRPAVLVGRADPVNAASAVGRLLGRRYLDPDVEALRQQVSYRIVDGPGSMAYIQFGDIQHSPAEIYAKVLAKVGELAALNLGEDVRDAVLAVPAHYLAGQREAIREAAQLAGVQLRRIVDAPTAVACAFRGVIDFANSWAVVYDLGGGSFDVGVIRFVDGVIGLVEIGGDMGFGGGRFDRAIVEFVLSKYPGLADEVRRDPVSMAALGTASEEAKLRLSGGAASAAIVLPGVLSGRLHVDVVLDKDEFESMVHADVERSIAIVDETLLRAGLTDDELDWILLAGGSTRLPIVRRLLARRYGAHKIRSEIEPEYCAAMGAALVATLMSGGCLMCGETHADQGAVCPYTGVPRPAVPAHVTARSYGIEGDGGRFEIVVPKGTRCPTSEPFFREFRTASDDQERIVIPVYEGEDSVATRNDRVGDVVIPAKGPLPESERLPRGARITIGFGTDADGLLIIRAVRVEGMGSIQCVSDGRIRRIAEDRSQSRGSLSSWQS